MESGGKNWVKSLVFRGLLSCIGEGVSAGESEETLLAAVRDNPGSLLFNQYSQDLGSVKQGEKLEFRFPYKVSGQGEVNILGIHQECGCLALSMKVGQKVLAGTESQLTILLDTQHFTGNLVKDLVILTNEDRQRPHLFKLKAKVEQIIGIQPPFAELDLSNPGEKSPPVRLRIQSASKQTLHVENLRYNEDTLDVQCYPILNEWEIQVRLKNPSYGQAINEHIELVTDNPAMKIIIPVVGLAKKSGFKLSVKP